MRAAQHVFRRGAVYWWRRRLLKKNGERELAPIAISLRARELPIARTIAAHLSVASDGILRQEKSKVLSAFQVRSILESVARSQLIKLDRLAVLETADGISAREGRSSDRVMGWVRRLQASQGFAASVGEFRAASLDGEWIDRCRSRGRRLDARVVAEKLEWSAATPKLLALLEASGASQSEGDLKEAERLYYRGQAAALLAVDRRWSGDFRDDDRLVEDVLAHPERTHSAPEPSHGALREPVTTEVRQVEAPEVRKIAVVPASVSPPNTKGAPQGSASTAPSETSITELAERLIGEKATLGEWNEKTQRQVRSLIGTFVEMIEDDDVRSLLKDALPNIDRSSSRCRKPTARDRTIATLLSRSGLRRLRNCRKKKVGREAGTLNRHLVARGP
ncbi:hypothetical protein Q2941_41045 [Bradyrhizobium sp. UFLA05-153]